MKNLLNVGFVALLLVVIGCNCGDKLKELSKKGDSTPPPATKTDPSNSSPKISAANYEVTMAKYEQVKIGMKRGDVENIFGGKGEEYYSGTGGKSSFTSVKWVGEKYKTVLVSFKDDKVTSKSQVGLNK